MSHIPKGVSIFGSARVAPDSPEYKLAEESGCASWWKRAFR